MKRNHAYGMAAALVLGAAAITRTICPVQAEDTVQTEMYDGVKIGPVDIGGMTKEEATQAVESYIAELGTRKLTLQLSGSDKRIEASAAEAGLSWANTDVLDNFGKLDKSGNVIQRYKMKKDSTHEDTLLELELAVDEAKIRAWIEANIESLQSPAVDAVVQKTEQGFSITPEQDGSTIDVDASVQAVKTALTDGWDYADCTVELVGSVMNPRVTAAECQKIGSTPMAEFTTSYTSSGTSRCKNIDAAVGKINGSVLMPGDKFSCLEHMLPFTAENGYYPAGSYLNGMLVDSYGGGVCQVSTTLYNAVLLAELEVTQRYNHGLTVGYVQLSSDAAIAESSGMDFCFINNSNAPVYIEGYTQDKHVTFKIYGLDERPANRKIEYKSAVIEVLNPPEDVIKEDPSLPEGARRVTQSSHTGYRAELYKYVYVDGAQVSKERVNTSYYAPAPNYVSVGPGASVSEEPSSENPENVPAGVTPSEQPGTPGEGQEPSAPPENPDTPGEPQTPPAGQEPSGETQGSPAQEIPSREPAETPQGGPSQNAPDQYIPPAGPQGSPAQGTPDMWGPAGQPDQPVG